MLIETATFCDVCEFKIITSFDNPESCPNCGAELKWDEFEDDEGYLVYYLISAVPK